MARCTKNRNYSDKKERQSCKLGYELRFLKHSQTSRFPVSLTQKSVCYNRRGFCVIQAYYSMVKRCSWGTCNADSRYPDRYPGVNFFPFAKPTRTHNRDKCLRWIKACGRPHSQLNVDNIRRWMYVCSQVSRNSCFFYNYYPYFN